MDLLAFNDGRLFSAEPDSIGRFPRIASHVSRVKNNLNAVNAEFKGKIFEKTSMKRVTLVNCLFKNCIFERIAATGSNFSSSKFIDCEFIDSNLQYCDFSKSTFESSERQTLLDGCCAVGSCFHEAHLDNIVIRGCSFTDTSFHGAYLNNISMLSTTIEGATFYGSQIRNVSFSNMNAEYANFAGANMSGVSFSLMQFAYLYGLTAEMFQQGNIFISTKNKEKYSDGKIPYAELKNIIQEELIEFYHLQNEYFPCANLYLMSKLIKEFKEIIDLSFQKSILDKNYRLLKHLCMLSEISDVYSRSDLHNMLNKITSSTQADVLTSNQRFMLENNIGYIQSALEKKDYKPDLTLLITMDCDIELALTHYDIISKNISTKCEEAGSPVKFFSISTLSQSPTSFVSRMMITGERSLEKFSHAINTIIDIIKGIFTEANYSINIGKENTNISNNIDKQININCVVNFYGKDVLEVEDGLSTIKKAVVQQIIEELRPALEKNQ